MPAHEITETRLLVLSAPMFLAGPTYAVVLSSAIRGDSGRPVQGVRVMLAKDTRSWGLIADHPANEGCAVTHASFVPYGVAACEPAQLSFDALHWFGLDREGRFCAWTGRDLETIVESGHETGSFTALRARLARLNLPYSNYVHILLGSMLAAFIPAEEAFVLSGT